MTRNIPPLGTLLSGRLVGLAALAGALTTASPAQAGSGFSWYYDRYSPPPTGDVMLSNQSGGTLTVRVENAYGGSATTRVIGAGQTLAVRMPAGETRVRATYLQFGQERVLETERTYVTPGRRSWVTLDPEDEARLMVRNNNPVPATFVVDGQVFGQVAPRSAQVFTVRPGCHTVSLRVGERTLESRRMELYAFAEPMLQVEAPRDGFLDLDNGHWLAATVRVDGATRAQLDAGRDLRLLLPVGWHKVEIRDVQGHELVDDWVQIGPFDDTDLRFGTPPHVRAEVADGRDGYHHGYDDDRDGHDRDGDGYDRDGHGDRDHDGYSGDRDRHDDRESGYTGR